MGYEGKSTFYNIPYMKAGDMLVESEEARKANIVGNLMYVATFGATNSILTDASYALVEVSGTNFNLEITTTNSVQILPNLPATFIGIINGYLAYRTGKITLQNLTQGNMWHVYACCNDSMLVDASQVVVSAFTNQKNDVNHLLLATVDFTGATPSLDSVSNKRLYANTASHSILTTNPHGTNLTQANLNITGSFKIASKQILPYVIVDIDLNGSDDVTIPASQTGLAPSFVTMMGDGGLVTVTMSGEDVTFASSSQVSIKAKIEGTPE